MAADIVGVPRKQAKDINLGLFYGMGKNKLAEQLGLDFDDAKELFAEYHSKVPFVQQLAEYATQRASKKGSIRTLLGRKCRFDKWEPNIYGVYKHYDGYPVEFEYEDKVYPYAYFIDYISPSVRDYPVSKDQEFHH